jgi:hypothetical protein
VFEYHFLYVIVNAQLISPKFFLFLHFWDVAAFSAVEEKGKKKSRRSGSKERVSDNTDDNTTIQPKAEKGPKLCLWKTLAMEKEAQKRQPPLPNSLITREFLDRPIPWLMNSSQPRSYWVGCKGVVTQMDCSSCSWMPE